MDGRPFGMSPTTGIPLVSRSNVTTRIMAKIETRNGPTGRIQESFGCFWLATLMETKIITDSDPIRKVFQLNCDIPSMRPLMRV
jgi:hypothetical protein